MLGAGGMRPSSCFLTQHTHTHIYEHIYEKNLKLCLMSTIFTAFSISMAWNEATNNGYTKWYLYHIPENETLLCFRRDENDDDDAVGSVGVVDAGWDPSIVSMLVFFCFIYWIASNQQHVKYPFGILSCIKSNEKRNKNAMKPLPNHWNLISVEIERVSFFALLSFC